jgi:tryptophan 2,3-dioxygenase
MSGENFVSFGEQGAQLTYGSYLQLPKLLDAQRCESGGDGAPPAHDELLFITIHQVYELWFQQLLHEVEAAREAMLGGVGSGGGEGGSRLWWAQHLLQRVHVIERTLVQQVDVLETMTPQDFLQFRQRFRGLTADEQARLARRLEEPTLWDAFLVALASAGLAVGSDEEVSTSLRTVAHDRDTHAALWALAEALLQHDELAASWRARHVVMVERMIGAKSGTGGSSGSTYLRSRLPLQYYPLLWELRSNL